jgi:hypothetical protein
MQKKIKKLSDDSSENQHDLEDKLSQKQRLIDSLQQKIQQKE